MTSVKLMNRLLGFCITDDMKLNYTVITINCASFVSNIVLNKLNTFNFSIINWFSFMTFYLVRISMN